MKSLMLNTFALMLALLSVPASASPAVSANGTTVTGKTWNRPSSNGLLPPIPPLSSVGTNVQFEFEQLYVDLAGTYSFKSTATNPAGWDNYTFLYKDAFNPVSPIANVLIANDDLGTVGGPSGFSIALLANTNYFFVNTGFNNSDAGAFTKEISGPGNIYLNASAPVPTPAPEPLTLALLGLGLAGLGLARRKY